MIDWIKPEKACNNCTRCDLHKTRNHMVLWKGDINTNLMFIGEGSGEQEDLTGIPSIGKSGELFDKILNAVDISREDIYIANIVKCRPPKNRNPLKIEKKACLPYLHYYVILLKKRMLGKISKKSKKSILKLYNDDLKGE